MDKFKQSDDSLDELDDLEDDLLLDESLDDLVAWADEQIDDLENYAEEVSQEYQLTEEELDNSSEIEMTLQRHQTEDERKVIEQHMKKVVPKASPEETPKEETPKVAKPEDVKPAKGRANVKLPTGKLKVKMPTVAMSARELEETKKSKSLEAFETYGKLKKKKSSRIQRAKKLSKSQMAVQDMKGDTARQDAIAEGMSKSARAASEKSATKAPTGEKKDIIKEKLDEAKNQLKKGVKDIASTIDETKTNVTQMGSSIKDKLKGKAVDSSSKALDKGSNVIEKGKTFVGKASDLLKEAQDKKDELLEKTGAKESTPDQREKEVEELVQARKEPPKPVEKEPEPVAASGPVDGHATVKQKQSNTRLQAHGLPYVYYSDILHKGVSFQKVDGKALVPLETGSKEDIQALFMAKVIPDLKNCAKYVDKFDSPTSGPYKGIEVPHIFLAAREDDIHLFLHYVLNSLDIFKDKNFKFSEAFASWIIKKSHEITFNYHPEPAIYLKAADAQIELPILYADLMEAGVEFLTFNRNPILPANRIEGLSAEGVQKLFIQNARNDIKRCTKLVDQFAPNERGPYADIPLENIFSCVQEEDIQLFLVYVYKNTEFFSSNTFKLSELFASWLVQKVHEMNDLFFDEYPIDRVQYQTPTDATELKPIDYSELLANNIGFLNFDGESLVDTSVEDPGTLQVNFIKNAINDAHRCAEFVAQFDSPEEGPYANIPIENLFANVRRQDIFLFLNYVMDNPFYFEGQNHKFAEAMASWVIQKSHETLIPYKPDPADYETKQNLETMKSQVEEFAEPPVYYIDLIEDGITFLSLAQQPLVENESASDMEIQNEFITNVTADMKQAVEFVQQLPAAEQGPYAGVPLGQLFQNITQRDIYFFLHYVQLHPEIFADQEFRFSEVFASWVIKKSHETPLPFDDQLDGYMYEEPPMLYPELLDMNIEFLNINQEPLVEDINASDEDIQAEFEDNALADLKACTSFVASLPAPQEGPYANRPIVDIFEKAVPQDINHFIAYVQFNPEAFVGKNFRFSEAFASWLMKKSHEPLPQ